MNDERLTDIAARKEKCMAGWNLAVKDLPQLHQDCYWLYDMVTRTCHWETDTGDLETASAWITECGAKKLTPTKFCDKCGGKVVSDE